MSANAAVQPLPLPDWQRRPKKQRRVYRGPPGRRPRHHGGRDSSAGAMGTPNEGGLVRERFLPRWNGRASLPRDLL